MWSLLCNKKVRDQKQIWFWFFFMTLRCPPTFTSTATVRYCGVSFSYLTLSSKSSETRECSGGDGKFYCRKEEDSNFTTKTFGTRGRCLVGVNWTNFNIFEHSIKLVEVHWSVERGTGKWEMFFSFLESRSPVMRRELWLERAWKITTKSSLSWNICWHHSEKTQLKFKENLKFFENVKSANGESWEFSEFPLVYLCWWHVLELKRIELLCFFGRLLVSRDVWNFNVSPSRKSRISKTQNELCCDESEGTESLILMTAMTTKNRKLN